MTSRCLIVLALLLPLASCAPRSATATTNADLPLLAHYLDAHKLGHAIRIDYDGEADTYTITTCTTGRDAGLLSGGGHILTLQIKANQVIQLQRSDWVS